MSKEIPAITGSIDRTRAIQVFPPSLAPYKPTVLAYCTSFVATVIGFPLDTVKTRMQSYKKFSLVLDCVAKTLKYDGVSGFYRGIWAPLFSTAFIRSINVSLFTNFKPVCYDALYSWNSVSNGLNPFLLNVPVCFMAGAISGMGSTVLSCPFEFTKNYSQIASLAQNVQFNAESTGPLASLTATYTTQTPKPTSASRSAGTPVLRQSTVEAVKSIVKHNGPMGLYTGFKYQIIRDGAGSGVYYAVYETFKWAFNSLINGTATESSPISILVAGGMSGVTSWVMIFPIDTAKSLLQKDVITNTLRKELGLPPLPDKPRSLVFERRMYRGLGVSVSRSFLVNMVFFGTYEFSMKNFI